MRQRNTCAMFAVSCEPASSRCHEMLKTIPKHGTEEQAAVPFSERRPAIVALENFSSNSARKIGWKVLGMVPSLHN